MAKDLRSFLAQIKDRILHIQKPADPLTEMGGVCQLVEQPVLFDNVKGYKGWKVVDRLFASRELVALAAGVPVDGMLEHLRDKWLRPPAHEAVTVDHAPVKEKVVKGKEVNLEALPVVVSSPKDSGRFLSAAHLISVNPETGDLNAAFSRTELKGKNLISSGLYRPDTLRNVALHKERGRKTMPIALCIGHHPAFDLSASASFNHPGYSEHEMTGNLLGEPVELTQCETVDLKAPAHAEIVIEAEMDLTQHVPNGPFGEYTIHYGYDPNGYGARVTAVLRRGDAIYRHLNATRFTDHQVLTGAPHAVQIYSDLINKGHQVHDVDFPPYGSRLLLVIKATPRYEGEARDMFLTACARNAVAKFVVIVDDDVDIDDPRDIFNVLATNADPVESLMTLEGLPSNLLNPTARDRSSPYTCTGPKILIDATRGSTMGRPERREEMERIGFWPGIALKDFL
ncbi:MAG: UbiD family decarboxylase [Nitrospinota bacterium]|jgi:UbiD family decarboxylase|nr:UbiD family decarboxylase [Nitrospinota bacterium]